MRKFIALFLFVCIGQLNYAQTAKIIKFDKLDNLIHQRIGKITVINFWATWCGPCIKELPYFEALTKNFNDEVDVNLISVDFVSKIKQVNNFILKKKLKSSVYLLDEMDYNSWINRVDSSWSGAIPATLIIDNTTFKRKFIEGELKEGELELYIKEFLN